MRVLFCRCNITYQGRIDAQLELGDRLIVMKDDGAVVVHANVGLMPRNWMPSGSVSEEIDPGRHLRVTYAPRGECLDIYIDLVFSDTAHVAHLNGPLVKTGLEREMCDLLVTQLDRVEVGLKLVAREAATPVGPIDVLCVDAVGDPVAVEVKRQRATGAETVYQILRYLDALAGMKEWEAHRPRGILVAPGHARTVGPLLARHAIGFTRLGFAELRDGHGGLTTPKSAVPKSVGD